MTTYTLRGALPLPDGGDYVTRLEHLNLVNAVAANFGLRTVSERPFSLDATGVTYDGGGNRLLVELGPGRVMSGGDYPTGVEVVVSNPQPNTDYWVSVTPNGASSTFPATTSAPSIATSVWLYKIHTPASLAGGTYVVTDLRAELPAEAYVRLKAYVDTQDAAEAATRLAADNTEIAARTSAVSGVSSSLAAHIALSASVHGTDGSGVASKSYVDAAVAGASGGAGTSLTTHRNALVLDHPSRSVRNGHIGIGEIDSTHILPGGLNGNRLTAATVPDSALTTISGSRVMTNSQSGQTLLDNTTPGAKLQDASIPTSKYADGTIPTTKLVAGGSPRFDTVGTGSTPAAVGQVRLSPGLGIVARRSLDGISMVVVEEDGANGIIIGDYGAAERLIYDVDGTGFHTFRIGGTVKLSIAGASALFGDTVVDSNGSSDRDSSYFKSFAPSAGMGAVRAERRSSASGGVGGAHNATVLATYNHGVWIAGPNNGNVNDFAPFRLDGCNLDGALRIPCLVNGGIRWIATQP